MLGFVPQGLIFFCLLLFESFLLCCLSRHFLTGCVRTFLFLFGSRLARHFGLISLLLTQCFQTLCFLLGLSGLLLPYCFNAGLFGLLNLLLPCGLLAGAFLALLLQLRLLRQVLPDRLLPHSFLAQGLGFGLFFSYSVLPSLFCPFLLFLAQSFATQVFLLYQFLTFGV